ncbi:hypothetical protein N781_14950 [Pontibacillus halophilus JSM 076056 = DSM 19796]|uniref:Uncharacterized protein n=1 Tax=Pontibacillus halophilus JSM 076056 = DSM 19796 TaxID=1385510 RepID=A0A0A5IAB9_9BACI|nr:hypothetical protein N781_14950 [Pontibacillus halophilus JSM 076056 = DSM 19796]
MLRVSDILLKILVILMLILMVVANRVVEFLEYDLVFLGFVVVVIASSMVHHKVKNNKG